MARDPERIGSASQHLLNMINEVLDLARIEASRMEPPRPALMQRSVMALAHKKTPDAARRA